MRTFLLETMKLLETIVIPPTGCHHAITYAQYGSDQDGWEDRLALKVLRDGRFHCLFLDDSDFDKTPAELVADIAFVLNSAQIESAGRAAVMTVNLTCSPFDLWAADNGYDIAPAVSPTPIRIYADRDTQAACNAFQGGARSVAVMITESTEETEALREKIRQIAESA